ncbi:FKBP-type peptidyl-prolyl cis-trans isomerase [Flexibacter flexilis DSM 6793]|uniref:Peptidyl-prolyl cis-trans isomerase n=1 Tax=Flexibacter flexilis DSM 6793 TaxID=927664 RepID=A0A1I1DNY9_9BACT|nr:FKBP-type peptidyl-prolyl cis-trans isomerase [Flexibacter flexilis]SFB74263.1 FKBP-type peptidyl-prolyl cis-trans isomerase [Flexibacter flexilis DSM 6793]
MMSKKTSYAVLAAAALLAVSRPSFAQCDKCPTLEPTPDYCFTSADWPEQCAQFGAKSDQVYYSNKAKGKPVTITIPASSDAKALLALSNANKKLKVADVLFLGEAFKKWAVEKNKIGYTKLPSGLEYKVLTKGTGPKPIAGKNVTVHYRGSLEDGKVFDSSFDRGEPATFPIGVGRLIKGWDEGIPMFEEGTRLMLRIPPELGYGSRDMGSIPPNSTLYFEIEIIKAEQ